ncbi:hypothetical protein E1264_15620 [Actinomadura sp. KC216]|nr:hypothetical protein E1264_15620 [Actinomadura sp. KC216]
MASPRTRYALTPHGRALGPVLQALWNWGSETVQPPEPPAAKAATS